jgi:hypothetical protein
MASGLSPLNIGEFPLTSTSFAGSRSCWKKLARKVEMGTFLLGDFKEGSANNSSLLDNSNESSDGDRSPFLVSGFDCS